MNLKIVFNTWFVPPKQLAWVLYPFIFFKQKKDDVTIILYRHEMEHVYQVRRKGWLKFYITYIWYSIRYGYTDNPYEASARSVQHNKLNQKEKDIWNKA